MRHDLELQIKAVLSAYKLPILRANWALDPEGCKEEVVKACSDDLGLKILGHDPKPGPARRRGVIWHRHLQHALQELIYGHSVFERRYEYLPDGRASLVNLGQRPPWTLAAMNIGPDGVMREVTQTTQSEPIPANRLVWYVIDQEGANWAGVSPLRAAFGAWLLKHEGWRVNATSVRRFGMGIPVVEAPQGANATQVQQAALLAQSMRGGDQAGIGIPAGFKAYLQGISGGAPDGLGWIRYLDQSIAKSALAGMIELGQTETGSRALGETFMDLFLLSLQAIADDIATVATSGHPGMPGIVTDLVDQTWGTDEPAPRIVCTDVGENYELSAAALESLTVSGVISPDPSLDEFARKVWRLPQRTTPWVPSSRGLPAGTSIKPAVEQQFLKQDLAQGVQDEVPQPKPKVAASAPRRRENEAGFSAAAHQQAWQHALDSALALYRPVVNAQRAALVDQVQAATKPSYLEPPPLGDGPQLIFDAMLWAARTAMQAVIAEAGQQGVTIDPARVQISSVKLRGVATARAQAAAAAITQAASAKALQVMAAAPPPGATQPPPPGEAAAGPVAVYLDGFTDANLREQLGAALTAAQNHGRHAAFAAAPPQAFATYIATEVLDSNTCKNCAAEDGTEFPDLAAAEAAYPMGGFVDCLGLARCRGTTMAVWHEPVTAAAFDEAKHPRAPKGVGRGGEFVKVGDKVRLNGETLSVKDVTMHPERRHLPAGQPHVRVEPASRAGNVKRRGKWVPVGDVKPVREKHPVPKPGDMVRYKGEELKVHDVTMHPERRHLQPAGEPHVRIEPASRAGNPKRKGRWVPAADVTPLGKPAAPKAPSDIQRGDIMIHKGQPVGVIRVNTENGTVHVGNGRDINRHVPAHELRRPKTGEPAGRIPAAPKPPSAPQLPPGINPAVNPKYRIGDRVRVGHHDGVVRQVGNRNDKEIVRVDIGAGPAGWYRQDDVKFRPAANPSRQPKPPSAPQGKFRPGDKVQVGNNPGTVQRINGDGNLSVQVQLPGGGHALEQFHPNDVKFRPAGKLLPSAPQDKGKFQPGDLVKFHEHRGVVQRVKPNGDVIVKLRPAGGGGTFKPGQLQHDNRPAPTSATPKEWKRGDKALVNGEPVIVRHVGPGDVLERKRPAGGGDSMIRVRRADNMQNMWVRQGDLKAPPPPPKPKPFNVNAHLDNPDQVALRKRFNSGIAAKTRLAGGIQGDTQLATLNDGSKVVHKRMRNRNGTSAEQMASAEQLSYEVGNAIGGIEVMPVIRKDRNTVVMQYAQGASVAARVTATPDEMDALSSSPEGLRIGVMDILNANHDRHANNWMIRRGPDGKMHPIPIDNSSTYGITGGGWPGPFRGALEAKLIVGQAPFTRNEILAMDARLNELQAKFDAAGKSEWYQEMMSRWRNLRFRMEANLR